MYPFNPIQVIESTPTRLVLVDPPFYLAGGAFTLIALAVAATGLWTDYDRMPPERIGWPALVLAVPFALIAAALMAGSTKLTLSRDNMRFQLTRTYFGIYRKETVLPLEELQSASVVSTEGTRQLQLHLRNGRTMTMGAFTDRKGYVDSAMAIDAFLKLP